MERPGIDGPAIGPGKDFRLVGRTQSVEEADKIAEQYSIQGFETRIVKRTQGSVSMYEIWVSKAPDVFSGR